MGKYATTRAFERDRKRTREGHDDTWASTVDYITEVPDDRSQFEMQNWLYTFDPSGIYRGFIDHRDTMNFYDDYFKNTGLDWKDIKYPSFLSHYGSTSYASTAKSSLLFVSKNITRLYR